jgi:hypothetical protein
MAQLASPQVCTRAQITARAHRTAPSPREQPTITGHTCNSAANCFLIPFVEPL